MDRILEIVSTIASDAKKAAYKLAALKSETKNEALLAMAQSIEERRSFIKAENAIDVKNAEDTKLEPALIDRLMLNDSRIDNMIKGIRAIAAQSDPVGKLITHKTLENGIELRKIRVPIGVIGIIFESRPNVVTDVVALCLKSGNAVILRGGSEAVHSNGAIMSAINAGLEKVSFTHAAAQIIPVQDRSAVAHLCRMDKTVDLVIPRGGEALIKAVADCATVPVIKHYKGVCHIYVDEHADLDMGLAICHNAKCQRPGVCNAVETILVHEKIAESFITKLGKVFDDAKVEMRGDERACEIASMRKASFEDWETEYLALIVSIKVVSSLTEAISHINTHGSHHSDAIVSNDKDSQQRFLCEVDSAAVYANVSTRFTDGAEFGLGAEMGISTDKLHARGPMGLSELTSYKWVGIGTGQIRE
jgi:glutamate-5-semialdehyde dehydrogenase